MEKCLIDVRDKLQRDIDVRTATSRYNLLIFDWRKPSSKWLVGEVCRFCIAC